MNHMSEEDTRPGADDRPPGPEETAPSAEDTTPGPRDDATGLPAGPEDPTPEPEDTVPGPEPRDTVSASEPQDTVPEDAASEPEPEPEPSVPGPGGTAGSEETPGGAWSGGGSGGGSGATGSERPRVRRRMARVGAGRLVAGVCGGLGRYTGIDPIVFRVGFAVLVLADGWGVLLYVAAALLMAPDEYRLAPVERLVRRRLDGDAVLTLLGLLLGAGVLMNLINLGGHGGLGGPLTTVAIFALVVLVAQSRGVNVAQFVRTIPENLQGSPASAADLRAQKMGRPVSTVPAGAVDLATLSGVTASSATPRDGTYDLRTDIEVTASYVPYRRHSVLGKVTFYLAIALGAAMIPVVSGRSSNTIVTTGVATGLAVIGIGMIVSAWYGRSYGLWFVGAVLSVTLLVTAVNGTNLAGGRMGDVTWRPVDAATTAQTYKLIIGNGKLDLTALPLTPGQVVTVNVEFGAASVKIKLPRAAQVDVNATISFGDVTIDRTIHSGPRAKISQTLPPETATQPSPPRIDLRVHGRLGDLEVSHA